jgi:hypothetical protein
MSDEAEIARVAALQNASINFPELAGGTTRNALYRNTEESQHLGRAVLVAPKEAGYELRKAGTRSGQAATAAPGRRFSSGNPAAAARLLLDFGNRIRDAAGVRLFRRRTTATAG